MKRIYCLLLILMLVFTVGCAKKDEPQEPGIDDDITVAPPSEGDTVTPPADDTNQTTPPEAVVPPADTSPEQTPPAGGNVTKPVTPPDAKPPVTPPVTPPATPKPEEKVLSATEVADKLKAKYPMSDTVALDESLLADFYTLDMSMIDSFAAEIPAASTQALELAVFKLKDAADSAAVEKALNARKETLGKSFDGYVDDQAAMARAGSVTSKNGYVLLAIGENAAKIAELFAKTV